MVCNTTQGFSAGGTLPMEDVDFSPFPLFAFVFFLLSALSTMTPLVFGQLDRTLSLTILLTFADSGSPAPSCCADNVGEGLLVAIFSRRFVAFSSLLAFPVLMSAFPFTAKSLLLCSGEVRPFYTFFSSCTQSKWWSLLTRVLLYLHVFSGEMFQIILLAR